MVFIEEVSFKKCTIAIAKSTYTYCTAVWFDLRKEFALETEVFERSPPVRSVLIATTS